MDLKAIEKALNFLRPIIEMIEEVLDLSWDNSKLQEVHKSLCKRQYEIMSATQVLKHNLFPEETTLPSSVECCLGVDIDGAFITSLYAVYQIFFKTSKIYLDEEYFLDEEDSVS